MNMGITCGSRTEEKMHHAKSVAAAKTRARANRAANIAYTCVDFVTKGYDVVSGGRSLLLPSSESSRFSLRGRLTGFTTFPIPQFVSIGSKGTIFPLSFTTG
ncbi:hypothetical protein V8C42DRAFT_342003 [Trichoderma barbatum]